MLVEARGFAMLCAVTGENEEASECELPGTNAAVPRARC
jgi:hypothetical protein